MHVRQTKSKQITRIIKHKVLDEISFETWFPFPETNSKFQNHEIVSTNLSSNYKFRNIARARAHTHTNSEINIFTLSSLRSSRSSLNDSPLARETGWLSMIGDERREGKKRRGEGWVIVAFFLDFERRRKLAAGSANPTLSFLPRIERCTTSWIGFWNCLASPLLSPSSVSRNTWWTGPRGRECTVSSRCNRQKKKSRAVTKAGV